MELTPDYSVRAGGVDVSSRLKSALAELTVVRGTERASDSVEITLGDAAGDLAVPPSGKELSVRMGYAETALIDMGDYWHSETELDIAPERRLVIRATGADLRAGSALKAPRTRAWHDTTIGDIVRQIAEDRGYTARVSDDVAAVAIAHADQTAESDLHFLRRLALQVDAEARAVGQRLVFVRAGTGASASGADMPTTIVSPAAPPISARVSHRERPRYGAVRATWFAVPLGGPATVKAGAGDPVMELPDPYPTRAEAETAAASRLRQLSRQAATLELSIAGDPTVTGGSVIVMDGWGAPADGRWIVARSTHRIAPTTGYVTDITATPAPGG